jgi:predicted nuclease of restriction endonuclease-like (RecB) superfamily
MVKRELERQIKTALFERIILTPPKVSPLVTQTHPAALSVFKDAYLVEFLGLPDSHAEADLHQGLLKQLKDFLIELGRDFCFVGSEYPLQVGGRDFALDLLFFHRGLNCLVAIELKVGRFEPEYLGKLAFYLEALDRDIRKPHEHPALGVLLCASKDNEVVEYALSRTLSPALIAEYQTQLPDKKLLREKLHEFYLQNAPEEERVTNYEFSAGCMKSYKDSGVEWLILWRQPRQISAGASWDSETADYIAIAAYVPQDLPNVICGYHLSMIRPREATCGAFIKRLFDSIYVKSCCAVCA